MNLYLVVLCRRSTITSTSALEQLESKRVTGTKQRLQKKNKQEISCVFLKTQNNQVSRK